MKAKVFSILALLLALPLAAAAQKTDDGRRVKRITFDREQVTILYADGTQENGVSSATVRETTTGVKAAKPQESPSARQLYTTDGRQLQCEPQRKGIYIVKGRNGVRKTIKK